ncbi:FAD-dependent oxidoreductase [Candidatus Woesearchaeota archaeon]|nr:FAD-dependent oxidoreductase [Candidatus Woesearchaeota archaeon]
MAVKKELYDILIVGGGFAGISAAIYAFRFNRKVAVLAKEPGGLIMTTHLVENYPGFPSLSGPDLMEHFFDHLKYFNIPLITTEVTGIKKQKDGFKISTLEKEYESKTVILAMGSKPRRLEVKGEKEFYGKGVSYCAICDAAFFKNKAVAVVGGSDSAAKEALLLAEHAKKVFIIYRGDKLRAEPINTDRVLKNEKIEIIYNANVLEIYGDKKMNKIILDVSYKSKKELELDGLFPTIGHIPSNEFAKQLGVKLNEKGEVIVDEEAKTNISGLYCAGDFTTLKEKQGILAAAQGVMAAFSADEYLRKNRIYD